MTIIRDYSESTSNAYKDSFNDLLTLTNEIIKRKLNISEFMKRCRALWHWAMIMFI